MKESDNKIRILTGFCFVFIGIIGLINTGYISQTIVIIFTFIFGLLAYWILFPCFIAFGIYLIVSTRKGKIKFKNNTYIIGFFLFTFALLVLLTLTAYFPSDEKSLGLVNFNQYFWDSWQSSIYTFPANSYIRVNIISKLLSGGYLGHLFGALLNLMTPIASIISTCIIIAISIILFLLKPMRKLIAFIRDGSNQEIHDDVSLQEEEVKIAPAMLPKEEVAITPIKPRNNIIIEPINDEYSTLKKANIFSSDEAPNIEITSKKVPEEETKISVEEEIKRAVIEEEKPIKKIAKPFQLPPYDFLKDFQNADVNKANEARALEYASIVEKTFQDFKIGAHVVGHTIGPRVTRFDIRMNANASLESIPRFLRDISQRLGGVSTRFEAIVSGKDTSGLEVPNAKSIMISMKELLKALPYQNDDTRMIIPFGVNISGEIKYANLTKFPHMLVAGATGSGKSVFVNSVLVTLMYRNTPDELRFLIIDPKFSEFVKYSNSPYLLCPIISDHEKAKVALNKIAEEMDARYALFATVAATNIGEFNEYLKEHHKPIVPYIVVIVDEFEDLIEQNKKIDRDIHRIAAKARAAGIHLIIATQRPSVDVITGTIKNNLPVRAAFKVSDIESSRTILGAVGAEQLLNYGDMLISCQEVQTNGYPRLQGCYISRDEILKVCKFINNQRGPNYDPRFLDLENHEVSDVKEAEPKLTTAMMRANSDDELYNYIKETVYKSEYTSISVIQRDNGIGFTRAGRMFKRLQDEGLVSRNNEASKGSRVIKENFHFDKKEQKIGSEELTTIKKNV